jgi:hypothetical protein
VEPLLQLWVEKHNACTAHSAGLYILFGPSVYRSRHIKFHSIVSRMGLSSPEEMVAWKLRNERGNEAEEEEEWVEEDDEGKKKRGGIGEGEG